MPPILAETGTVELILLSSGPVFLNPVDMTYDKTCQVFENLAGLL